MDLTECKVETYLPELCKDPTSIDNPAMYKSIMDSMKMYRLPKNKRKGFGVKLPRRKKLKVPRCSSPSHFNTDEDELNQYCEEWMQKIPFKTHVDSVLKAVSNLYYTKRRVDNGQVIHTGYADSYKTLDLIKSPIRKPNILDNWTMREIALFECGICYQGKDFYQIAKLIETKTTNEVVEFYYHWKLSGHYQMFKYHGRPWSTNRRTACNKKVEQWKETNKVMKEFDGKS